MNTVVMSAIDNRPVCQPIAFFVGRLLDIGFTMLNNGDYKVDYLIPNDQSLFFRLQSPIKLDTLDLTDDRYYLADWGIDNYMCECHFHMVKLVDVV